MTEPVKKHFKAIVKPNELSAIRTIPQNKKNPIRSFERTFSLSSSVGKEVHGLTAVGREQDAVVNGVGKEHERPGGWIVRRTT